MNCLGVGILFSKVVYPIGSLGWSVSWSVGWLVKWSVGWLVSWLIGQFVGWSVSRSGKRLTINQTHLLAYLALFSFLASRQRRTMYPVEQGMNDVIGRGQ